MKQKPVGEDAEELNRAWTGWILLALLLLPVFFVLFCAILGQVEMAFLLALGFTVAFIYLASSSAGDSN